MKALFANTPLSKASKYQIMIRESAEYADENSVAAAAAVFKVQGWLRNQDLKHDINES